MAGVYEFSPTRVNGIIWAETPVAQQVARKRHLMGKADYYHYLEGFW